MVNGTSLQPHMPTPATHAPAMYTCHAHLLPCMPHMLPPPTDKHLIYKRK